MLSENFTVTVSLDYKIKFVKCIHSCVYGEQFRSIIALEILLLTYLLT